MNIKKKKKISSSTYRRRLLEMIKTELTTVYLTSNQKKFLSLNDALECESGEEEKREIIKNKKDEIMKIYELLAKVLAKNDWGIFFKGEPIEGYPTQDGMKMYKVNEIASDRLFEAIESEAIQMEKECQNEEETQTEE